MGQKDKARENERELIQRAKAYDPSAFAEIYEGYHQGIYSYVYYRVSDESLAEDLTADVFVRALESIDSFSVREGGTFSAWLYRIAANLVVDYYRSLPRQPDLVEADGLISGEEWPEELLEGQQTSEWLRQALRHLTEDQQQVVLLRFVDGLRPPEIAQVLGKTEGAVKSMQHRAVVMLSRILGAPEQ